MSPDPLGLEDAELRALDAAVDAALKSGDEAGLPVLGYGEISLVLGWPADAPQFACKRLPLFADRARFDRYRQTLVEYLDAIRIAGVRPVATDLRPVERGDGTVAGFAVQPILPARTLATAVLARTEPGVGHPLVDAVVTSAARTVTPRLGLDAQLSNWAWDRGELNYLDVTTPMVWDDRGHPLLDVALLTHALPWVARGALTRFVVPGILDTYRDLRKVYLDLTGNLIKQRLQAWLPAFLAATGPHLERPLTETEVRRYYHSDARLWALLLRVRRIDRAWQRRVRRRPYPVLLPKRIER